MIPEVFLILRKCVCDCYDLRQSRRVRAINIWNDAQDVMTIRDAGWILLFAENHQEAVTQHILAYKLAEKLKIPVMVNVDGFVLTHSYEEVTIPTEAEIKKSYRISKPETGNILIGKPRTFGAFATPADYRK